MPTTTRPATLTGLLLIVLAGLSASYVGIARGQETGSPGVAMPVYDDQGHLRLPPNYREWVFIGSSLGMSYSEGAMSHEMFHETLMEPGAYRHFVETGEFAEGTQFVLLLHGTGESVLPMRQGRFAAEVHGLEMAIKDSRRFEESWAYFGFGGMNGIRETAEAFPMESCHDCHAEHAALDNVFAQFYPLLTEAAGVEVALRYVGDETDTGPSDLAGPADAMLRPAEEPDTEAHADDAEDVGAELVSARPAGGPADRAQEASAEAATPDAPAASAPGILAYSGLDPVMLVQGREEIGKAEIVEDHNGWRYQFASEPNRAAFAEDPAKYAPRNTSCPIMPGAGVSPDLFAVHEGRVYAFGSVNCRETFKSDPTAYVEPQAAAVEDDAPAAG